MWEKKTQIRILNKSETAPMYQKFTDTKIYDVSYGRNFSRVGVFSISFKLKRCVLL